MGVDGMGSNGMQPMGSGVQASASASPGASAMARAENSNAVDTSVVNFSDGSAMQQPMQASPPAGLGQNPLLLVMLQLVTLITELVQSLIGSLGQPSASQPSASQPSASQPEPMAPAPSGPTASQPPVSDNPFRGARTGEAIASEEIPGLAVYSGDGTVEQAQQVLSDTEELYRGDPDFKRSVDHVIERDGDWAISIVDLGGIDLTDSDGNFIREDGSLVDIEGGESPVQHTIVGRSPEGGKDILVHPEAIGNPEVLAHELLHNVNEFNHRDTDDDDNNHDRNELEEFDREVAKLFDGQ